jgi:hypothetical protein
MTFAFSLAACHSISISLPAAQVEQVQSLYDLIRKGGKPALVGCVQRRRELSSIYISPLSIYR